MLRTIAAAVIAFSCVSFAAAQQGKPQPLPKPQAQAPQAQAPQAQATETQLDKDVEIIFACLERKAPEDVPESGPKRDKILADAEGGPQSCVGLVIEACQKAKGKEEDCLARETSAWLASLELDDETAKEVGDKNVNVYKEAASRIEAHAVALCRAAASVSGWGSEAIKTDAKDLVFNRANPCVFDAVAQQALIILVGQRGG